MGAVRADPAPNSIARPRVVDALARRWDAPLTAVVAPAGFGKSIAVAQARVEGGRHVEVRLSAVHADPLRLVHAVLDALGVAQPVLGDTPADLALAVRAGLLSESTSAPVCLVLDDLQALDPDGAPVEVLAALVEDLPPDAHVVLVGRRVPPRLRLARLRAAGRVVDVGPDALRLDDEEVRVLAEALGGSVTDVGRWAGWPAPTRLHLAHGAGAAEAYVEEEVVADLDEVAQAALVLAGAAGGVDDDDLRAADLTIRAAELVDRVPLTKRVGDRVVPSPVWDPLLPRATAADLARLRAVAEARAGRGDASGAVSLLAGAGDLDGAARAVLVALRGGDGLVSRREASAWLEAFPIGARDRPELLVLRGLVARLELGAGHGEALLRAAADELRARGDAEGEAVAIVQQISRAWHEADRPALVALHRQASALHGRAPAAIGVYPTVIAALLRDIEGDSREALRLLDDIRDPVVSLDPATRVFIELARCGLALVVGEGAEALAAVAAAEAASRDRRGGEVGPQRAVAAWLSGDPGPALGLHVDGDVESPRTVRDRFRADVYLNAFAASIGLAQPVDETALHAVSCDNGRDRTFVAMAAAASSVARGDEQGGAATLRRALARHGLDAPMVLGELRRFLPVAHVLLPEARAAIEAGPLGRTHRRSLALARVLLAVRDGSAPRWDDLPPPEATMAWLPLPWAVEVAAAARSAGRPEGDDLVAVLSSISPDATRRALDLLAADGGALAPAALSLSGRSVGSGVAIGVIGPLVVARAGPEVPEDPRLRRRRVRELLELLVVAPSTTRDAVMDALWPDLEAERARNNLSVTLGHLRRLLEPDGPADGDGGSLLRAVGDRVELAGRDVLDVDLWRAEDLAAGAAAHERAGRWDAARAAHEAVVELWRGDPLADLIDIPSAGGARVAARALVEDAALAAGRLAARAGDLASVRRLAGRLLASDPVDGRAHQLLLRAHLDAGDPAGARRAAEACVEALAREGRGPDPETRRLLDEVRAAGT